VNEPKRQIDINRGSLDVFMIGSPSEMRRCCRMFIPEVSSGVVFRIDEDVNGVVRWRCRIMADTCVDLRA
jgi:hypothetical protein